MLYSVFLVLNGTLFDIINALLVLSQCCTNVLTILNQLTISTRHLYAIVNNNTNFAFGTE